MKLYALYTSTHSPIEFIGFVKCILISASHSEILTELSTKRGVVRHPTGYYYTINNTYWITEYDTEIMADVKHVYRIIKGRK